MTYGTVTVAYDEVIGAWVPDTSTLHIDPPTAKVAAAQGTAALAPGAHRAAAATLPPTAVSGFVKRASASHLASRSPAAAPILRSLIFVRTSFVTALNDAAQLGAQHQIANMFVFSFPLLGNLDYAQDSENAGKSHAALAGVIEHLFAALQPHAQQSLRLEMLCHSIGNFVLSGAFKIMTSGHLLLQTVYFRHSIHAAADVFAGVFDRHDGLAQIVSLAEEIEIYTNEWYGALATSFLLHIAEGDPDRLGTVGPQNFSTLPRRVNWIDCSQVAGNPFSADYGHGYYTNAPAVVADLDKVLKGQGTATIQPRQVVDAPNHSVIPVDAHTITLVKSGQSNSAALRA